MPTISVIIPIYNGARYLRECLDAVCRQTLTDIEIICVDDGSTDNSPAIAAEYAARDGRVRVYSLGENRGAAAARNYGMRQATGEYLGFVDCDDYPCLDFYEKLFNGTENGKYAIVKGNYRYWGEDGRSIPVEYSMNEEVKKDHMIFSFAFASAIYNRVFIELNSIYFPEDQNDMEDPVFALCAALKCNGINIIENAEINIRINKYSLTYGIPSISHIQEKFNGLQKIIHIINKNNVINIKSYAFIVAFWLHSILNTSSKNKSERSFRTVVDNLLFIFFELRILYDCEEVFRKFKLESLFFAFQKNSMSLLMKFTSTFYDKMILYIPILKKQINKRKPKYKNCIAIPIYKETLNTYEERSLRQCFTVLYNHSIYFFCPENLDTEVYNNISEEYGIYCAFERFPKIYFSSTRHYSRLLLSPDFYNRFLDYTYIQIYQLDAWVFRDELDYWCDQGFDYIGAPWFVGYDQATENSQMIQFGGNGGFSLRNTKKMLNMVLMLQREIIDGSYDMNMIANEDTVIADFGMRRGGVVFPDCTKSMFYAWEHNAKKLYRIIKKFPFGLHAIELSEEIIKNDN